MVYVYNIEFWDEKVLYMELCRIFGIGKESSKKICNKIGLSDNIWVKDIKGVDIRKIVYDIDENYVIETLLKNKLWLLVEEEYEIKSYKAFRKIHGLPTNGQWTRSNRKTSKKLNKLFIKG